MRRKYYEKENCKRDSLQQQWQPPFLQDVEAATLQSTDAAAEETTEDVEAEATTEEAEDAEAAEEATDAAEVTTVEPGVLTMGTNATFPPYEYKDGDAVVGIDPDIAQALADKLGLKLESG